MASPRHIIVLGLGTFGAAVAKRLAENGCRVTGVDESEDRVGTLKDELYEAVIADVTDPESLAELPIENAHAVFLSLGDNFERSILAALHIKDLGAKRVLAKGVTKDHGRILEKLGVDQIIYPEEEAGVYWADRETWPNVVDFLPIGPDFSLVEIAAPEALVGKTLAEADLRRKYGISIIGVKDALQDRLIVAPGGDFKLTDDHMLLVIGGQEDVDRFREVQ